MQTLQAMSDTDTARIEDCEIDISPDKDENRNILNPEAETNSTNGTNIPDGGWGWVVVIAGVFVCALRQCTEASFPVFYFSLMDEFHTDFSQVTQVLGSFFIGYGVTGIIAPISVEKLGCRKCMILFGGILSISTFIASFQGSFLRLLICFGFIQGVCYSMAINISFTSLSIYFTKRFNLTCQLLNVGYSLGVFIGCPTYQALIEQFSWNGAILIISAISMNMVVAGSVIRPIFPSVKQNSRIKANGNSDDADEHKRNKIQVPGTVAMTARRASQAAAKAFRVHLFKDPTFYILVSCLTLHGIGMFASLSFAIPFSVEVVGISETDSSFIPSAIGAGEIVSRLVYGMFFNKIPKAYQVIFMSSQFLILALLFLLASFAQNFLHVIMVCAAIGLFEGGVSGVYSLLCLRIYGSGLFPTLFGYTNVIMYTVLAGTTLLIGRIVEITENLTIAIYVGVVSNILCATMFFILHRNIKSKNSQEIYS